MSTTDTRSLRKIRDISEKPEDHRKFVKSVFFQPPYHNKLRYWSPGKYLQKLKVPGLEKFRTASLRLFSNCFFIE